MKPGYERFLEGNANALRQKCDTGAFERLDPFKLAAKMGVQIVKPILDGSANDEILNRVLNEDHDKWDAGTMILPDGSRLVVLNPTRGETRQRATMMEELAHLHLGHKPSKLIVIGGITMRTVKKADESAAYHVGAAALLPARILKGASTRRYTAEQVAEEHGVSMQLLKMRENLTGIHLSRLAPQELKGQSLTTNARC